jgi:hypothetical protein
MVMPDKAQWNSINTALDPKKTGSQAARKAHTTLDRC